MGAFVVEKFLETRSALAAVLIAPVPPQGVMGLTWRLLRRNPEIVARCYSKLSLLPLVSTPALVRSAFFSADMPEESLIRYTSQMQEESFRAYLDLLFLNVTIKRRTNTPIMILGAADDALFTPQEVEAVAYAYGTSAEIFPGMAHDMMLERNWRAVADRIIDWLRSQRWRDGAGERGS